VGEGAKLYLLADKEQSDKDHRLMTRAVALQGDDSFALELPASYLREHWYAAYTCANHEKRVGCELKVREVEHFLPLYNSVRRWKDRRVHVELPLFPGYVFVRLALRRRLEVLQIPSVVRLVGFNSLPTALPDDEIEALRKSLAQQQLRVEPHPYLTVGRRVRIKSGPLCGLEGIVVRRAGKVRVVLSVDLISRSFAADVDSADLEPLAQRAPAL
jgi:transcription termination/antitermination protein NusG